MAPETLDAAPPIESTEIETVAREVAASCRRAVEHRTPLFLLVFYGHEKQKLALLASLRQLLREAGVGNQTLDPRHRPEHAAGKLYTAIAAGGEGCVSILFDLPLSPKGFGYDPSFLAYLNFHRDRIAREKLRIVLLLPSSEADLFARVAGDLWDFRQHTWWLDAPAANRGEGLWRELDERSATMPLAAIDKGEIDEQIRRVRALVERTKEPADRAAVLLDLSRWLADRYASPLALEVALEGLAQGTGLSTELLGLLEAQVGHALRLSDRSPEALPHYESSLALFRETGDRTQEAACLNNISQIYHNWGRFDEALQTLEKSLAISREVGNRTGEAETLNNIAQLYSARGKYLDALKILEQSLTILRQEGEARTVAIVLNNMGDLFRILGRNNDARRVIEMSLEISRRIGDKAIESPALNNLSLILDSLGHEDEARRALERSLAICREIGSREGEAMTNWNLGHSFERRGDFDQAIRHFHSAVAIQQEIGHPAFEVSRAYLENLEKRPRAA